MDSHLPCVEAALLHGDVAEAARLAVDDPEAASWAPLLATLAYARQGGPSPGWAVALPEGGPAALAVLTVGGEEVVLLGRDLRRVGQVHSAGRALRIVAGAPWVHAFANGEADAEINFRHALDPAWDFKHPAGLRRDPAEGTLHLTVAADLPPVAELPIAWEGGPLALEFELDIERIEYGACLRLAVLDRDDVTWIGAAVCAIGGGGRLLQIDRCGRRCSAALRRSPRRTRRC